MQIESIDVVEVGDDIVQCEDVAYFGGGPDLLTLEQVSEMLNATPEEVMSLRWKGVFRDFGQGRDYYLWPDVEQYLVNEIGMIPRDAQARIADVLWGTHNAGKVSGGCCHD